MPEQNKNEFLLVYKGKVKDNVEFCKRNGTTGFVVKYKDKPIAHDHSINTTQFYDSPIELDIKNYEFFLKPNNMKLFGILKVLSFDGKYYKVFYNTKTSVYPAERLIVIKNALSNATSKNLLSYFRKVAEITYKKTHDKRSKSIAENLLKQYEKIEFLNPDTVAAKYLNPSSGSEIIKERENIIFPFGCNLSQISAVEKAINNQISIIEGPPGTGKTQTILNIIANVLLENKSLAVVSNNNPATDNVFEKLEKNNFSYLAAQLGRRDNVDAFFEEKQSEYPPFNEDKISESEYKALELSAIQLRGELSKKLEKQNRNAILTSQLADLTLEQEYFNNYFKESAFQDLEIFKNNSKIDSSKVLSLLSEIEAFNESNKEIGFFLKLKFVLFNSVKSFSVFKESKTTLAANLKKLFYLIKSNEINAEIKLNLKELHEFNFDDKLKEFTETSKRIFRAKLAKKYSYSSKRPLFTNEIRSTPADFIKEYPIVLSTTFAIKNTLPNYIYDYVIVDEASQVGLSTAFLALSCAKRVVIVGDLKQLPNVIAEPLKKSYAEASLAYSIPERYRVEEQSLLSSAVKVFADIPKTLLKEHYRCHPKIIDFCNKRFYNNQLVIMSKDNGEKDVLTVRMTSKGNHARGRVNQRQIDEVKNFVLPKLNSKDVGIIAPYNDQADELQKAFPKIENISTVHKFQGRENDDIIITTVDNEIKEFTDNPNLLNVAVSRAKNRLVLVISDNEKNENTNTGGLVNYVKYNSFEVIQSDLYSVFDLLYKANEEARKEFLNKRKKISEYDSENIMYALIEDVLADENYQHYAVAAHIPLSLIIRNFDKIKDDKRKYDYAKNPATHVDFLIYSILDKSPLLAIEVDGHSFHNKATDQHKRDQIKDEIFSIYDLPLIRFSTTGSNEKERLIEVLKKIEFCH